MYKRTIVPQQWTASLTRAAGRVSAIVPQQWTASLTRVAGRVSTIVPQQWTASLTRAAGLVSTIVPQHWTANRTRAAGLVFFVTLGLCLVGLSSESDGVHLKTATSSKNSPNIVVPDLSQYSQCSISFLPPSSATWTTKPILVPSPPNSGASGVSDRDNILTPILDKLTLGTAGTKMISMSSKKTSCESTRMQVAACTTGPEIETRVSYFYPDAVFAIRNFGTSFPANFNDRSLTYGPPKKSRSQVPVDKWREFRDRWFPKSVHEWANSIKAWKQQDKFRIGVYAQYEKLWDPTAGPQVVQELALLFQTAGFAVPTVLDDISCVWYQSMKDEYQKKKDFMEYIPGYTLEQKDMLLAELVDLTQTKEIAEDDKLMAILKEYQREVLEDIPTDKAATIIIGST
jgi:hypothetical protein